MLSQAHYVVNGLQYCNLLFYLQIHFIMVIQNTMRVILAITLLISLSHQSGASAIALFHALDEDLAALKREGAAVVRSFNIGAVSVQQLSIAGHAVYAVKMGSGCVQSCLSAQALLLRQPCDLVISVGPVGDIKGSLETKTWYRISEVVAWQSGTQSDSGFVLNREARYQIALPQASKVHQDAYATFPAIAIASGEMFIASDSFRADLAAQTHCAAVDMNLFGLVTVIASHHLPSIHLRTPSDHADSQASEDFRRFAVSYQGEGGRLAAQIIRTLPEDRTSPQAHSTLRRFLSAPASAQLHALNPQSEKAKDRSADHVDSASQSAR